MLVELFAVAMKEFVDVRVNVGRILRSQSETLSVLVIRNQATVSP